jgi:hypothetical protein
MRSSSYYLAALAVADFGFLFVVLVCTAASTTSSRYSTRTVGASSSCTSVRCVRLVERVADRRLHRRALHRRAVPSAEAAHMHRVQGEDRRHQFDRRGHGLAGLPLLDSRSDQRQRREGGVRDETRLPRVHEGGKFCRHDGHAHSALRADRHHEHDDRQEPLSLQQETPGEFHRRKPLHGHDRIAALKHSGRTSGLSFASQIIEVSKFVRRRKVINFSRR